MHTVTIDLYKPDQLSSPSPPFLLTHGWILTVDEYGAQLKLMDAICLWQAIIPAPVFLVPFIFFLSVPLKRKVS